ncbi:MAG: hypothetical protein JW910_02705 [Anaerolineae bacterium]|nr:hypothetical protein [Anaerolineae bacterium]
MMLRRFIGLLILLLLPALACNLTEAPQVITATPADVLPSDLMTVIPFPTVTDVPPPTSADLGIVPSATPIPLVPTNPPPPTATPQATRVHFTQGGTSLALSGQAVTAGSTASYVLEAAAGQVMTVVVDAPPATSGDLRLLITGADGTPLAVSIYGNPSWSGDVPTTQDYFLTVQNRGGLSGFTLYVTIPQRVRFASGTTSTIVEGTIPAQGAVEYVLEVAADQVMLLSLSGVGNQWLSVHGADGVTYLRADQRAGGWNGGPLPATQDYTITIYADTPGVAYTLNVTIPQRVRFAAGGTSTTVSGTFGDQFSIDYVVEARAGQRMQVNIASANSDVLLTIFGMDGNPLIRYQSGATSFDDALPATQNYIIRAVHTAVTVSNSYTMTITITG